MCILVVINPLSAQLNPIGHVLALLGAHHIFHVSRIWVRTLNYEEASFYLFGIILVRWIFCILRMNNLKLTMKMDPLNVELNPICNVVALLGARHIFHISGLRVKDIINEKNAWNGKLQYNGHHVALKIKGVRYFI